MIILFRKVLIVVILLIDWKRLLFMTSIFTLGSIFVQTHRLPHPLHKWVFSPAVVVTSHNAISEDSAITLTKRLDVMQTDPARVSSNSIPNHSTFGMEGDNLLNIRRQRTNQSQRKHMKPIDIINSLKPIDIVNSLEPIDIVNSLEPIDIINSPKPIDIINSSKPIDIINSLEPIAITNSLELIDIINSPKPVDIINSSKPIDIIISPPSSHFHVDMYKDLLKDIRSMKPNEALVYARTEIENAPVVFEDPDLYAPLFRNVSTLKRSYEMMELMLKVYIYKEGKRPIFHEPHLQGIYSSEGWFMKLMEENRQFVTRDAEKAHLFYLPYSARQLQKALYVPDSHNLKPLSLFLRDHVNFLANKYPYWNHSRGSDHFIVACHDWGPYTLSEHKELRRNTIKALCNADASEKIFIEGKDVSLPETTIRNPRRPLRNIGGKRASQRPILAFFAGHMHGRVRPRLLKYWSDKDEDMKIYGPLPNRVSRTMSYTEHMKSSKYCICPMGYEVNSPRIVESIYYECVPVIIADNFVPPFNEVLDWSAFSVIVPEKDIPRLKEILLAIPMRKYVVMQKNVKMLQKHFHWHSKPIRYDLFHMILHSIWSSRLNQIQIHSSSVAR